MIVRTGRPLSARARLGCACRRGAAAEVLARELGTFPVISHQAVCGRGEVPGVIPMSPSDGALIFPHRAEHRI